MLVLLSLALVAALAVAPQADAHQIAGRTLIYLDGELVKNTKDDHFTYERRLSPGCHTVELCRSGVARSSLARSDASAPTSAPGSS